MVIHIGSTTRGQVVKNESLTFDYIDRAKKRLSAIDALYKEEAWADVVRESQEAVELALKALLRFANIEVPRIHDVSGILLEEKSKFSKPVQSHISKFVQISKSLRRDRELAFYGSEDLTPQEFYKKEDANIARDSAHWLIKILYGEIVSRK